LQGYDVLDTDYGFEKHCDFTNLKQNNFNNVDHLYYWMSMQNSLVMSGSWKNPSK